MAKDTDDKGLTIVSAPNWQNVRTYEHLLAFDRSGWAWEWLRRNPVYAATALAVQPAVLSILRQTPLIVRISVPDGEGGAARWGLHFRGTAGSPRR